MSAKNRIKLSHLYYFCILFVVTVRCQNDQVQGNALSPDLTRLISSRAFDQTVWSPGQLQQDSPIGSPPSQTPFPPSAQQPSSGSGSGYGAYGGSSFPEAKYPTSYPVSGGYSAPEQRAAPSWVSSAYGVSAPAPAPSYPQAPPSGYPSPSTSYGAQQPSYLPPAIAYVPAAPSYPSQPVGPPSFAPLPCFIQLVDSDVAGAAPYAVAQYSTDANCLKYCALDQRCLTAVYDDNLKTCSYYDQLAQFGSPPVTSYGSSPSAYSAPSSYSAPSAYPVAAPAYLAPAPSYSAPAPSYPAPAPAYNPAPSYPSPTAAYPAPAPSYPAPTASYPAPAQSYPASAPGPAYPSPSQPSYSGAFAPPAVQPYPQSPSSSYGKRRYRRQSYGQPSQYSPASVDSYNPAPSYPSPTAAYPAPAPSYPAATQSYPSPAPSYPAAVPAPSYPAPSPSYPALSSSYPAPAPAYNPAPSYPSPTAAYPAPAQSYPAPTASYPAPAPSYPAPAPAPAYPSPSPSYPSPTAAYPAPAPSYPAPSYPSQSPSYPAPPAPSYPSPSVSYPSPTAAYPAPAPSYPSPSVAYPAPAPSYPAPAPAYSAPAPTASYPAPAPSYPAPAPSYPAPAAPAYSAPSPTASYPAPAPAYPSPTAAYSATAASYGSPAQSFSVPSSQYSSSSGDSSYGSSLVGASAVIVPSYRKTLYRLRTEGCPTGCRDGLTKFEAPEKQLVGYVFKESTESSFTNCVIKCQADSRCKSGHFYVDDGSCLLKHVDKSDRPDLFVDSDGGRHIVTYFEPGCYRSKGKKTARKSSSSSSEKRLARFRDDRNETKGLGSAEIAGKCKNPDFFVIQDKRKQGPTRKFRGLSVIECTAACSDDKSPRGAKIKRCNGLAYTPSDTPGESVCEFYTSPNDENTDAFANAPGTTYLRKFCLPGSAPPTCAGALVQPGVTARGLETEIIVTANSLETCLLACLSAQRKLNFTCSIGQYKPASKRCELSAAKTADLIAKPGRYFFDSGCDPDTKDLILNTRSNEQGEFIEPVDNSFPSFPPSPNDSQPEDVEKSVEATAVPNKSKERAAVRKNIIIEESIDEKNIIHLATNTTGRVKDPFAWGKWSPCQYMLDGKVFRIRTRVCNDNDADCLKKSFQLDPCVFVEIPENELRRKMR